MHMVIVGIIWAKSVAMSTIAFALPLIEDVLGEAADGRLQTGHPRRGEHAGQDAAELVVAGRVHVEHVGWQQ